MEEFWIGWTAQCTVHPRGLDAPSALRLMEAARPPQRAQQASDAGSPAAACRGGRHRRERI